MQFVCVLIPTSLPCTLTFDFEEKSSGLARQLGPLSWMEAGTNFPGSAFLL